ncbi:STAS domain-containing protein [Streptomyces sp. NPDC126514]|uniref:STAS domain-containing protein n=1 Tax=Streptomyces sp. NPDC126514 TaxID=3155210 RepID=UPI003328A9E7
MTAIPLAAHLDVMSSGPHPDLVLDLRPVAFIDCAGLGVLCRTRSDGRLQLITESRRFLRILRTAGLGEVFEVHPDPSRALARTPAVDASPVATG